MTFRIESKHYSEVNYGTRCSRRGMTDYRTDISWQIWTQYEMVSKLLGRTSQCEFSVSIDINKAPLTQMLLHQPHTSEKRYVKRSQQVNGVFTARKRSLGQGNIFSSVCQEFCPRKGGEVSASVHAGIPYSSPWDQATPSSEQTPPGPGPPGAVHAGRYGQ